MSYAFPLGGMPSFDDDPAQNGAHFTESYALIPAATMRDITASLLPGWIDTRCWILARPLSGFADYAALAFEPQYWPNAPHEPSFPKITVKAGEVWTQEVEWRFTRLAK